MGNRREMQVRVVYDGRIRIETCPRKKSGHHGPFLSVLTDVRKALIGPQGCSSARKDEKPQHKAEGRPRAWRMVG